MPKHLVKCLLCGETFDASIEPFVKPRANRYAHKSCAENANSQKTKEERDKEELEAYIKQLFDIPKLTPKINQQIKKFHDENNYTYTGILKSLKYHFEIRHGDISKANGGIGIVPYIYDQAFVYWRAIWEAQQRNEKIEITEVVLPVREIHIPPPERQPISQLSRKLFSFLEEGDDD